MVNTWIEPIYDRTYGSVQAVESYPDQINPKGAWNATDLNRIENNTAYVIEWMMEQKIIRSQPQINPHTNNYWQPNMIPTNLEIRTLVNNVIYLINESRRNPAIADKLPTIYPPTQMNYVIANEIERALDLMHNQPKLPLDYFELTINNGIIKSITRDDGSIETIMSSTALIAEDEIATIRGIEYGEDAQYQVFTAWSGEPDDLQYLGSRTSQETTYIGQYRDVEFTANFETRIPRTLSLTNGYISPSGSAQAETGPRTGTYYAGDQILIIADRAPTGKAFYEWLGTEEALDHIQGASETDPSTCWLTMPDCNVSLYPKYINAGQHSVSVTNGSVYPQVWNDYNTNVSISANVPSHYGFDNWSGDTSYLEDIYSSYQSFKMPDVNISFRANYSYRYSYNDVQVINGKIRVNGNDYNSYQGLRQSTSYTLIPEPPSGQGVDYWQVEGYGSVSGNTFTVGDGNAIITGHYAPLRTLNVVNINNGGTTNPYSIVQGHSQQITTNYSNGYWYFRRWEENGTTLSTNRTIIVTMGSTDRTITAVYEYVEPTPTEYVTLTKINENNNGQSISSQVVKGNYITVSSQEVVGDNILEGIYKNGTRVTTSTSYYFSVSADTTIDFRYRPKEEYTLTVQNGHIVATGETSGTYKERTQVQITADDPAVGATFIGWSVTSGSLYSSTSSKTGYVTIGRSDATISAQYQNLRSIRVITNTSDNTYSVIQGNGISINAGSAPSTYEWDQWSLTSGDARIANTSSSSTTVYAQTEDSVITAQYKPIPWFTVTMIDGYVKVNNEWVSSATLLRNSTNDIQMKPAPTGQQFLRWEVYVNGVLQTDANDVYQPLAETTRLNNLLRNITIKATYYTPDPELTYDLVIYRRDGTTSIYSNPAGRTQSISPSWPLDGYKFSYWTGDTSYLMALPNVGDNNVQQPPQNISLTENYVPEDYVVKYHLWMVSNCECCYETTYVDPETQEETVTEHWVNDWEYEPYEVVKIRTKNIPFGWKFTSWSAVDDLAGSLNSIFTDTGVEITTLAMPPTNAHVTAGIAETPKYELRITDGDTPGDYYEDYRADIVFNKQSTQDVEYDFIRWVTDTGSQVDVSQLKLYDGGMFNVLTPTIQYIKMPAKNVKIKATYNTKYKLYITGGTIDSQDTFFLPNTTINITANEAPIGMRFQRWEGDTSGIANIYDPTTTVTTVIGITTIRAVYSTDADRNDEGYVLTQVSNNNIINNEDITIISGELELGCMITDSKGHIYIATSIGSATTTVMRLTKISKGGDVYE